MMWSYESSYFVISFSLAGLYISPSFLHHHPVPGGPFFLFYAFFPLSEAVHSEGHPFQSWAWLFKRGECSLKSSPSGPAQIGLGVFLLVVPPTPPQARSLPSSIPLTTLLLYLLQQEKVRDRGNKIISENQMQKTHMSDVLYTPSCWRELPLCVFEVTLRLSALRFSEIVSSKQMIINK